MHFADALLTKLKEGPQLRFVWYSAGDTSKKQRGSGGRHLMQSGQATLLLPAFG